MVQFTSDQLMIGLTELDALALTIYGESRGEPVEGQIGVGSVIRNRVVVGDYANYKAACLAPLQFSCWNKNDVNFPILVDLADKIITGKVFTNPAYIQARYIASGIIDKVLQSNVNNATNYVTNALYASQDRPQWVGRMAIVREIGNHMFLRK